VNQPWWVGRSQGRGPEPARCDHPAHFEDFTRAQRAAGTPWWPFFIDLFDLVAVKG